MILSTIVFYIFATILVASSTMVVVSRNPVYSVLFLILSFFNAAGLFLLLGAEFLAMILVIVYVGAVAVLFLFVVMMLDVNFVKLRQGFARYLPIGIAVGGILMAELAFIFGLWAFAPNASEVLATPLSAFPQGTTNTTALGEVIYTKYAYLFQTSGLVLLLAMVGAIVLTLRHKPVRRQNIADQIARRKEETLELVDIPIGAGV